MNAPVEDLYIGRQPIYDRDLSVVAYELLFRDDQENRAEFDDGDYASTQVIINTFMELGLENIVGSSPAYINLPRAFFTGEHPLPFTSEQVVLELLEDVAADPLTLSGLARLRHEGFKVALDDFEHEEARLELLDHADVVKVDLSITDMAILPERLADYQQRGLKVLAEKVESQEDYQRCHELGFDLFQGYFFCEPKIIRGKPLPSNRLSIMNLLAKVQDPKVQVAELESLISKNLTLSYRLLRYINCATFALRREVDSIHQAILLLGLINIKNWLSLMLMSKGGADKPRELMTTALLRARFCELLAAERRGLNREQAFTVGLFSVLDALMDQPMDELLDAMPLSTEIKLALIDHEGELGRLLAGVTAYERGDYTGLKQMGIDISGYRGHYLEAISWADEATRTLYEKPQT